MNIADEAKRIDTLSTLVHSEKVLFVVRTNDYTSSHSLAAPKCLAQALTVAVAARVQQNETTPPTPTVTGF
ncbi:hypothetical protein [Agrobacterium sp. AGB01]|uniref:hypothetical protein n=1 Tax=Agrobacterium sp. AGB01 TaxID=2769302 RepID=UPI001FF023B4|nr:hypothetical protein [Agrobacterium sp. AGB01]